MPDRSAGSDADTITQIDAAVSKWRQADGVLAPSRFQFLCSRSLPLTSDAIRMIGGWTKGLFSRLCRARPVVAAQSKVRGLVLLTQTCDIVRSCADRPFIEVAPLVQVTDEHLEEIRKARRPAYAYVPGFARQSLVADLDRVMTVEKGVVAGWTRLEGCSTNAELREFAKALARKRARFAFPDAFGEFAKKLQQRLTNKHDKETAEGRALRALREIRVRAAPSWNDKPAELFFYFIQLDDMPDFEGNNWADFLENWLKLVPESDLYQPVNGQVATLDDLTARDFVESDPLDLDHLSRSTTDDE